MKHKFFAICVVITILALVIVDLFAFSTEGCLPHVNIYNVNGSTDQGSFDFEHGLVYLPNVPSEIEATIIMYSDEKLDGTDVSVTITHPTEGTHTNTYTASQDRNGILHITIPTMYVEGDGEVNQMMYSPQYTIETLTTQINVDAVTAGCTGYEAVTAFITDSWELPEREYTTFLPIVINK